MWSLTQFLEFPWLDDGVLRDWYFESETQHKKPNPIAIFFLAVADVSPQNRPSNQLLSVV
jgi:hypothetical protein